MAAVSPRGQPSMMPLWRSLSAAPVTRRSGRNSPEVTNRSDGYLVTWTLSDGRGEQFFRGMHGRLIMSLALGADLDKYTDQQAPLGQKNELVRFDYARLYCRRPIKDGHLVEQPLRADDPTENNLCCGGNRAVDGDIAVSASRPKGTQVHGWSLNRHGAGEKRREAADKIGRCTVQTYECRRDDGGPGFQCALAANIRALHAEGLANRNPCVRFRMNA